MKRQIVLLAAVLTAASLWVQGCSKPAEETAAAVTEEAAEEETEEGSEEESEEETPAEETEEAEAAEAQAAAEAADAEALAAADEASAAGIPAEYAPYLAWTYGDYSAASDEEKTAALVAYVLYDGIVYQNIPDLTAEDIVQEMEELEALREIVETSMSSVPDLSLQEICDMGHSTAAITDVELDDTTMELLQCTMDDWNAGTDEDRMNVAKAMVIAVGKMTGQDITMDQLAGEEMEALLKDQVASIQALFDSGLYGDATLYEMIGSAQ